MPASIRSRGNSPRQRSFPRFHTPPDYPDPARRLTVAHGESTSHKRCPTPTPRQTRPRRAAARGNPSTDGSEIYPHRFYSSSSCSSASASSSSHRLSPLIPSPLPPPSPHPSTPVPQNIQTQQPWPPSRRKEHRGPWRLGLPRYLGSWWADARFYSFIAIKPDGVQVRGPWGWDCH